MGLKWNMGAGVAEGTLNHRRFNKQTNRISTTKATTQRLSGAGAQTTQLTGGLLYTITSRQAMNIASSGSTFSAVTGSSQYWPADKAIQHIPKTGESDFISVIAADSGTIDCFVSKQSVSVPQPLFSFGDSTSTRASEAALSDPRTGWSFPKRVTSAEIRAITSGSAGAIINKYTSDDQAWGQYSGTPTITTGQADPFGGTLAVKIQDLSGVAYQIASTPNTTHTASDDIWVGLWVKKDVTALQFPSVQLYNLTTPQATCHFSLVDGTFDVAGSSADNIYIAELIEGWWWVAFRKTTGGATDNLWIYVAPAAGLEASRWTLAASAQGAITVFGPYLASATQHTHLLTNPTPWSQTNEPRIFDDGAVLIESARTNLVTYTEFIDRYWNLLTEVPMVTGSAYDSPSGEKSQKMTFLGNGGSTSDIRGQFAGADDVFYSFSNYLIAPEAGEAPADIKPQRRSQAGTDQTATVSVPATWTRYLQSHDNESGFTPRRIDGMADMGVLKIPGQ